VVLEVAAASPRVGLADDPDEGRPLPRSAEELARDLRFIQMELLMSPEASDDEEEA